MMFLAQLLHKAKIKYREEEKIWFYKYKIDMGINAKWSKFDKIKYNRLGFTSEDYHLFDLKHNDFHEYISYRERLRLEDINGRFAYILGEKLMFERLFGNYINVPHIFCWIKNGRPIDLETGEEVDLLSIIQSVEKLIVKPTRSSGGGAGVHKICIEKNEYFIDEKKVLKKELLQTAFLWEGSIIVDYINQAEYSNNIYSETTNSIRVVTVKRKNGEYEVVLVFHRFGCENSKPVDNICSGGLVTLVDISTGKLGKAKRITEPEKEYSVHPDTQEPIEGILIPNWEALKEKLIQVHRCFSYYTFLAWDVVINDIGVPYILEINRGTDLNVQLIKPLRNDEIGRFMDEYGLLDKHR